MMKNILSRKGSKKVTPSLDESWDDFEPVPTKRSQRISKSQAAAKDPEKSSKSQKRLPSTEEVSPAECEAVANDLEHRTSVKECPFCLKEFPKNATVARRNAHLKVCGIQKGLKPEDLLKVRRLEEKQAAEWADLGLPKPPDKSTHGTSNVSKRKKANGKTDSTGAADYEGLSLGDPQLEMALALSASMAGDPNGRPQAPTVNQLSPTPPVLKLPPPQSLVSAPANKRGPKKTAKTCLEVRTQADRDRQVSEKVAQLLYGENGASVSAFGVFNTEPYEFVRPVQRKFLQQNVESHPTLWNLAAQNRNFDPYTELFAPFKPTTVQQKARSPAQAQYKFVDKSVVENRDDILSQFESLFDQTQVTKDGDMEVYVKDEKTFYCHSAFVQARCPKLLETALIEKSSNKRVMILTLDKMEAAVARQFLRFIYCGSFDATVLKSVDQRDLCLSLYSESKLRGLKELLQSSLNFNEDVDGSRSSFGERDDATQNLDYFLEEADKSGKSDDSNTEERDEAEWSEVHDYLTQKANILEPIAEEASLNKSTGDEMIVKEVVSAICSPPPEIPQSSSKTSLCDFKSEDDIIFVPSPTLASPERAPATHVGSSKEKEPIDSPLSSLLLSQKKDGEKLCKETVSDMTTQPAVNVCPASPDLFADSDEEEGRIEHSQSRKRSLSICEDVEEVVLSDASPSVSSAAAKKPKYGEDNVSREFVDHDNPRSSRVGGAAKKLEFDQQQCGGGSPGPPLAESNSEAAINLTPVCSDREGKKRLNPTCEDSSFTLPDLVTPPKVVVIEDSPPPPKRVTPKKSDVNIYAFDVSLSPPSPSEESVNQAKTIEEKCDALKVRLDLGDQIEKCLDELGQLADEITIDVLLSTGVGKPVHKLLSSIDKQIREKATRLVAKWKRLIAINDKENKSRPVTPRAETPRPNYEDMLSPALRKELRKFGLKVIPRSKAVPLLNHIYDETHPKPLDLPQPTVVAEKDEDDVDGCSQTSQSSSVVDEEEEEVPEESMLWMDPSDNSQTSEAAPSCGTQQAAGGGGVGGGRDLHSDVIIFIQSNPDLHRQCLTYEPIWLEKFFDDFKAWSGLNSRQIKINQVMDILDNECITFRTVKKPRRAK